MKIARFAFALALALSLTTAALAQGSANGSKPNGAPKLVIKEMTHDFGVIKAGEKLAHSFIVKNEGTAPLEILSVSPS
ncbi:MAG TPA: DUF1573 domain-containing protein [Blastocatellia bacterium]|nr:DUF1573 domain-containing protein [Blastocatellia bacterium]